MPFLRAGFDVGEPGLLSCSEATTDLLRRELGDDPPLRHLKPQDIYATPSGAMAAYQEIVDGYVRAGVVRVRLVAEAAFVPDRARWDDWGRYEAVVNHVMRPYPVSAICAYDVLSTPPAMLVSVQATHPYLARGSTHAINPLFYVEPAVYLRRTAPGTEGPLESTPPVAEIDDLTDLGDLRRRLESALYRPTHAAKAVADFILAIHEVATNAARHGRPPVDLRLWVTPNQFLCTVTDQGEGFDDPLAGYVWPGGENAATGGTGLWLARQLCDQVDIFHSRRGFTVRLRADRDPTGERSGHHQHGR